MKTDTPVWLLDVDGVINAATRNGVWPAADVVEVTAPSGGLAWVIRAAQPVLDFISRIHSEGLAEIRWHTTWQHEVVALAEELGLPRFAVQDAPEFHYGAGPHDVNADGYEADGWWKYPAALRVV